MMYTKYMEDLNTKKEGLVRWFTFLMERMDVKHNQVISTNAELRDRTAEFLHLRELLKQYGHTGMWNLVMPDSQQEQQVLDMATIHKMQTKT